MISIYLGQFEYIKSINRQYFLDGSALHRSGFLDSLEVLKLVSIEINVFKTTLSDKPHIFNSSTEMSAQLDKFHANT